MDRRIGIYSSLINVVAVIGFAVSMLLGSLMGSYISSIFIALSFIPMVGSFNAYRREGSKSAGATGLIFAAIYGVCILIVYFTQLTTVRLETLPEVTMQLLNYGKFSLFFNYNLLGYGLMALSTFFIGLTVRVKDRGDTWLKWLLIIHGVFAIACFLLPVLGIFSPDMANGDLIGTLVLEFWCLYFIPVGILSYRYFKRM